MRPRLLLAAVLLALPLLAPALAAQDEPGLATVVSRDGATKMVLMPDHVAFLFTEEGARRIERDAARSSRERNGNAWSGEWVRSGVSAGVRGMRMRFDLAAVREARFAGGALTLYMESRPADAPEDDRRGRFVFEDVEEDGARAFIRELERAKGR